MDNLTENEQAYLDYILSRVDALRDHLNRTNLDLDADLGAWLTAISELRAIQGNISNDVSFLATLMVKQYLTERFPIEPFDAAEKAQGAPGLDIDITTADGKRIVGEIKTTVPYQAERRDLGAAQRSSFQKDFKKLNEAEAAHKFFFVTDPLTYEIMHERYVSEIPGVEVVLLPEGNTS